MAEEAAQADFEADEAVRQIEAERRIDEDSGPGPSRRSGIYSGGRGGSLADAKRRADEAELFTLTPLPEAAREQKRPDNEVRCLDLACKRFVLAAL